MDKIYNILKEVYLEVANAPSLIEGLHSDGDRVAVIASKFRQKTLDKVKDLSLIELPCPIGTVVHEPYKFCGEGAWEIDHHYLKLEDLDKIGKTIFVDENDAKAYIAEREAEEIKG